jgi:hypothetical protein
MASHAALPWYDFPSTQRVLDAVWQETMSQLRAAGVKHNLGALDHTTPHRQLLEYPQLALSQCCGLDLCRSYTDNVVPFAVPVISALPVAAGQYFSYIVSRSGADLERPRVVINDCSSHSGHTALRLWLVANKIANYTTFESGSHAESIAALNSGRADVAAIDALTWRFLAPENLHILDTSEPVLAPPFIMGRKSNLPVVELTAALHKAFQRHGEPLGITGVLPVSRRDYDSLATLAEGY